ncbi:extragenic suppressor of kinetochore protein 1 [Fusarium langsethiae]|uniref:Extragenic suppressor of kinetochore protein 1 n=1 Tax=Fusarium langsethiae TaxID=179993 RepID=A0A0N0V6H2_FUSLA|nr:extragenic suppressor of kinetochore protein 1 [Fusarium langsethiae]
MFWRFGGYANISTIDTILDKPDFTLEELLDESDLIQELKQHNSKLIEYLRSDKVLDNLLDYVVAPKLETVESPDESATEQEAKAKNRFSFSRPRASSRATDPGNDEEEEQEKKRNRYAFVACEILSSDTWSIYEALADNRQLIRDFWKFLSRPAPLDPLQASYFTKVNESLFEKKTEEMMELLTTLPDAVPNLLKHVECPMVMDLLLKIIALDRNDGGQGVVEWLYSKDIIPSLLSCLGPENNWVVQTAAGDFIKAIITISANASQNEQQCIGPNELTRQLVSKPCIEQLIGYMLGGGNPLTVGVGIIIEVIRKNNSDYDPDMGTESTAAPSSRDPIYLGTLLRLFAENVPKFMSLIMDVPSKKDKIDSTFGVKLEPLGFDRFKTCELMAELLHCSNMGLLNEPGSEEITAQRDVERQRLRKEGKLGPIKEEDHSADDLTMRTPAPEEKRRLEVTNADDDGFEEVEPSKEMSEDTSHEFVKAEDDIPAASTISLSAKDEDDFVDEPLSPPQTLVKVEETQFDEPDLMVAPLSPTKVKATESTSAEPAKADSDEKTESKAVSNEKAEEQKPSESKQEDAPKEDTSDSSVVLTPAPSEPEAKTESSDASAKGDEQPRGFSPQPEDTPAPLFSAPPAPESGADRPPQTPEKPDAPKTEEASTSEVKEEDTKDSKPTEEQPAAQTEEPVVGDFLKHQFVEYRVVPTILNFFFGYPWNNFLHNVVYDIVQQVFNGPMDRSYNPTLAVSLFEAADVTSAIINGQKASDESQAKTKTRMGYMGHLTLIAEEVVKFTERHPPELLSETVLDRVMSQEWISYVEGSLAETRERDNAILGGVRPEVAMGNRAMGGGSGLGGVGLSGLSGGSGNSGSSALAEAGLNGGIELNQDSGNGIGPFTISAGTLMSGFGSSSDEEDEDGDGDEEDVNSEFRAYTDPLNNSGGSLDPPSIPPPPPPPPPLNIPPSRARLQLAARLAMHQKNNQAQSSGNLSNDDDDDDNPTDPFADTEEDFDDDDQPQDDGRGAWWRDVVRDRGGKPDRNESDDERDDDDDDEFGDFAMPEDDAAGDQSVLRPQPVNPAKEASTRGLSGLWPFGLSKAEKEKEGHKSTVEEEGTSAAGKAGNGTKAVEVTEAKRRTSIEDPDDDEVVV